MNIVPLIIKDKQFAEWLDTSRPGDAAVYHLGLVGGERYLNINLDKKSDRAWRAFLLGYVDLVQRKLGPFNYQYIAIKRRRH